MTTIVNNTNSNRGIGFVGLLTLIFITLKLTNFIDWSWWWVLSPLWITFIIWVLVIIGIIAAAGSSMRKK